MIYKYLIYSKYFVNILNVFINIKIAICLPKEDEGRDWEINLITQLLEN